MTKRQAVLDAAVRLVRERGVLPSLEVVAAEAGVSKGGLLHHFPDRRSLVHALVLESMQRATARLEAAPVGERVRVWLELATPDDVDLAAATAVLTGHGVDVPDAVPEFEATWERLLTAEVGSPMTARVVRLAGDGLFAAAVTGRRPTPADIDELVAFFRGGT